MFGLRAALTSSTPEFLPPIEDQTWLIETMREITDILGPSTTATSWFHPPKHRLTQLDDLFELMCAVQERWGQRCVELTLVHAQEVGLQIPPGYAALADATGMLMTTLTNGTDYVVIFDPAAFRQQQLLLAHAARELGRISLAEAARRTKIMTEPKPDSLAITTSPPTLTTHDHHARAELAAILGGLGVWVANGAYVFENACCGGGCGINLSRLRAGLSLPEASFALAVDGQRRQLSKRALSGHLEPTQKQAFVEAWRAVEHSSMPALAPMAGKTPAALGR